MSETIDRGALELMVQDRGRALRGVARRDWELSTLGDPLADLAYQMLAWVVRADRAGGKAGVSLAALGIPVFEAYIAWYAKRRLIGPIDPALTNLVRLALL